MSLLYRNKSTYPEKEPMEEVEGLPEETVSFL